MKNKRTIALILVILPLALAAVGLIFRTAYGKRIDADPDPGKSFDDGREFITILTLAVFGWLGIPCAAIARRLSGDERTRFVNAAAIVELALAVPIVLVTFLPVIRIAAGLPNK